MSLKDQGGLKQWEEKQEDPGPSASGRRARGLWAAGCWLFPPPAPRAPTPALRGGWCAAVMGRCAGARSWQSVRDAGSAHGCPRGDGRLRRPRRGPRVAAVGTAVRGGEGTLSAEKEHHCPHLTEGDTEAQRVCISSRAWIRTQVGSNPPSGQQGGEGTPSSELRATAGCCWLPFSTSEGGFSPGAVQVVVSARLYQTRSWWSR